MEDLTNKLVGSIQLTENDVISHAADLFRPVSQEVSMLSGRTVSHRPTHMNQVGPYEFAIHARGKQYIQLSKTRLYMKLKIIDEGGDNITAADNASFCNLIGNSMFKACDIMINGKTVPDLNNSLLHYKTYLETLLSYSESARNSHLTASRLFMDTAGAFDDVRLGTGNNEGTDPTKNAAFTARRQLVGTSTPFEVVIPIHSDFLQIDRFFPPGINFTIKLTRESDKFVIMSSITNKDYKIIIEDMQLFIRYIDLEPRIVQAHEASIKEKPVLLPMNKSDFKIHTFTTGQTSGLVPNLFTGNLPKSIILVLLDNRNYNGVQNKNPYNFQHFSLNYLNIKVNGEQIPIEPYTPDFASNLFMREYRDLFDNLGIHHDDAGNAITPELYKEGACIFAFDLSPDLCNGFHHHPQQIGQIDLDMKFGTALPQPITLLAMGIYNAIVSIDKNLVVNVDV
jgi:hypothetical protein